MIPLMLATTAVTPAPPAPDPRPEPLDSVIAAIRPSGRLIGTLIVAQDGSGDHTTISDATAEARDIQSAQLQADGLTVATPNHRVDIIVKEGRYEEDSIRSYPRWAAYYADGDVIVTRTTQNATGVADIGGYVYIEGFDFLKTTPPGEWTPKYPTHNAARGTTIWANVGFWTGEVGGPHRGRASGNDGNSGSTVLFYKCRANGDMASHGWDSQGADSDPQHIIFVETVTTGSVGFRSGDGGGGLSPDVSWVVGGQSGLVQVSGPNASLHLDPAHATGSVAFNAATQTQDTHWPIPFGGLSPRDRAHYGMGDPDVPIPADTPGY